MKGHLEKWVCNKSLLAPIRLTRGPVIFLQVETGRKKALASEYCHGLLVGKARSGRPQAVSLRIKELFYWEMEI
jgi:hypothetical protein